jgi:hypothetical protein
MVPRPSDARLRWLEANAHRPEVQDEVRQEILKGTIRVIPAPGDGVRIIPVRAAERPDRNGPRS